MSFNTAKIINVYYKADRKPYDANGKPISYFGEEFNGANEATEVRFFMPNGEDLGAVDCVVDVKRPNGDKRFDLLTKITDSNGTYYRLELNDWYSAFVGKVTIAFKAYKGGVTIVDGVITSVTAPIYVSDIFHLQIAYAPNSTEAVPPFDPSDVTTFIAALSAKLNVNNGIFVIASALPTLTGDVYDGQWFLVKNNTDGELGRLYYIDGSTAIAVELELGKLKLTSNGNADINVGTNAGKMYWDEDRGTIIGGLYDDQETGIGDTVFFFGKATEAISKGEVVQFDGNTGGNINFKKADFSEISAQPDLLMGVAKHNIPSGDFGYVVWFGYVRNLNTDAFTTPILYLSTSVDGALSSTKPTSGFKGSIAAVARASNVGGSNGFLIVRPNLVKNINDLSNVTITTVADDNILRYNSTNSRWENTADLTDVETDITEILNGTQIVGKAVNDQNGDEIDTTYLKVATASSTYVPLSSKGQPNGVAPLGPDNKILSIHLPGGVDDIKEFADLASFPLVGEASIIYVALDTNKIYRWGGSAYVEISSSLALGTTATTAFPGDRGLATETKTDNIVSGVQGLTDTRITNSATTIQPLIVNGITGTTADLQRWQVNSVTQLLVTSGGSVEAQGSFRSNTGLRNLTATANSFVSTGSTGTNISRNVADGNPALIVDNANSSSTGDILRLQFAGANKLEITKDGFINQNGTRLFSNPGTQNIFVGIESGSLTTTGSENTALGRASLSAISGGIQNTAIGRNSFSQVNSPTGNTGVGWMSGFSITGSNGFNTFIGNSAGNNALQLATATNSTAIGHAAYTDKSNQMVFGNSSVSEFVFNRNTNANALLPQITASSANLHLLERTTTDTNTIFTPLVLQRTTTGDMTDGFGASLSFRIKDNSGVENGIARVQASRSGADNSGRLSFTTFLTGTETERMTIMPDGKVGIGTSAPAQALTVIGTDSSGIQIRRNSTSTDTIALLGFRINTDDGADYAQIRAVRTNRVAGADTDLRLFTFTGGTLGERLRIRDDGLVGINETSPTAQLQVKSGATTRVPLIIDTLASQTANLAEYKVNGTNQAFITSAGHFRGLRFSNVGGNANAYIDTTTNGTIIARNVADANPALIVNLENSSATGNIQVWQKAGVAQSFINNTGVFVGQSRPESKEETGDYTLAIADEGKVLRANSSSNRTITIPLNSGTAIPIGAEIAIIRMGTGTVSISPTAGVTLNSVDNNRKIKDRYGSVALKKIATDEWVLAGSLEA